GPESPRPPEGRDRPGPRRRVPSGTRARRAPRAARLRQAAARLWAVPAWRFLLRYPALTVLAFLLPAVLPAMTPWLIHATVRSLGVARLLLPTSVQAVGSTLSIGPTLIEIVPACTLEFPTLLLAGGIVAFPAPWRWKLTGIVLGSALLWAYNLVRIYMLMAVLRFRPALFDLVHVYLWQSITLLPVLGCFF